MDKMILESEFVRGIISKLIRRAVKKKYGYEIDVSIDKVNATYSNGKMNVQLGLSTELTKEELWKILKM